MHYDELICLPPGTVLQETRTPLRRPAVLLRAHPYPNGTAMIQYLNFEGEKMDGIQPGHLELGYLRAGTLLKEVESGRRAILVEDTKGPQATVSFLDTKTREEVSLFVTRNERRYSRFSIAEVLKGTVARENRA